MKYASIFLLCAAATLAAIAEPNVTNTVMMVDQRGNLNVEGVATVADVATNAVKATIAEAKALAAQETAHGVTNALQAVVSNIMSNNMVVYRSGFSDSFAALVLVSDNDTLVICDARWVETSAARIVVEVDYVISANIGTVKPIIMHRGSLGEREDFAELDESNVTTPVWHSGSVEVGGQVFSGYYSITATIPNPSSTSNYFLWIKVEGDTPSGDGTTLDLPNGVTGGITGEYVWGDKVLTFRGGVLVEVEDAE